jgi:hypothetical protein
MRNEMPNCTLGQLISDIEGSERNYNDTLRTADRIEARDGHNLAATWWRTQAEIFRFQRDPVQYPGIDRIEALCDEFGTGLTSENVRKLRGRLCAKLGVGTTDANAMTLEAVADALGLKEDAGTVGNAALQSTPSEDLAAYNAEDQPWWTPLPHTGDVPSRELVSFAENVDVVLITATDPEIEAVLRVLKPCDGERAVLKGFVEQETYYVGLFGSCVTAATKCRTGSLDSGAAILATNHAQKVWRQRPLQTKDRRRAHRVPDHLLRAPAS